jgi:Dyp-type peroxidase family
MWSDQNNSDTEPQLEIDDIQGDILVGLQKDFEWFVFFKITDLDKFKELGRNSLVSKISSTTQVLKWEGQIANSKAAGNNDKLPAVGVNLGFTKTGLDQMKVEGQISDDAFNQGPANRSFLFKDPQGKEFSSDDCHGVVLIAGPTQKSVDTVLQELFAGSNAEAWTAIYQQCGMTRPNNRDREHFGFSDGISQPGVRGRIDQSLPGSEFLQPRPDPANPTQQNGSDLLWPGEFVFGYLSAIDPTLPNTAGPDAPGKLASGYVKWARNGSLMVLSRLRQFVPEFISSIEIQAQRNDIDPDLLASRVVGRWKSGAPLELTPVQDDPTLGADTLRNNNFDFNNDGMGRRCPFASHIRKTYERSDETTYSHRILRRGIPFGPELTKAEEENKRSDDEDQRGLMFVCYQTSIVNQFEYIANRAADDALLGQRQIKDLAVSYPVGPRGPTLDLREFVRPTGGGYFFMPSLSAFKFFVDDNQALLTPRDKTPGPDLPDLFNKLVDRFNAGDYQAMRPFLHPNITWTMLHHADSSVGADDVVAWLLQQKSSLKPQFTLPVPLPPIKYLSGDGGAQISGRTQWQANSGSPEKESIYYNFTFTKEDGQWLLINAFGAVLP